MPLYGGTPSVQLLVFNAETGTWDPVRAATRKVLVTNLSVTASTDATLYTPTTGKKWRIFGTNLIASASGFFSLFSGASAGAHKVHSQGSGAGGTGTYIPDAGTLANAINDLLVFFGSATGTLNGSIAISEE